MLIPESQVKIWLYGPPTDMRKSFDGLSALVRSKLAEDPLSGQLFVFINRRRTQLKVLYFDRGGYSVWAKRLEQGRFHPHAQGEKRRLEWTELKLIRILVIPITCSGFIRSSTFPTRWVR